jgi:hypothetical protein
VLALVLLKWVHIGVSIGYPAPTLTYALMLLGARERVQTLALYANETVGDAVATFCALHQVPQDSKLAMSRTLSKRVKDRAVRGLVRAEFAALGVLGVETPLDVEMSSIWPRRSEHLGSAVLLRAGSTLQVEWANVLPRRGAEAVVPGGVV